MGVYAPTSRGGLRLRLAKFDLVWAIVAPFLALGLRDPGLLLIADWANAPTPPYIFAAMASASAIVAFLAFRLSDGMSRFFSVHDVMSICAAVGVSIAATSIFMFTFTRLDGIPRSTPLIFALVLGGGLVLSRAFLRLIVADRSQRARLRPDQLRNVIIVGADHFAGLVVQLIAAQTPATTRVLALLDERSEYVGRTINGVRIVGSAHDLDPLIEEYLVHGVTLDQVLVSDNANGLSEVAIDSIRRICGARGLACQSLSEALILAPKSLTPVVEPAPAWAPAPAYFRFKQLFDIVAAVTLMVVLSPLALAVCALVLMDVGAPVLFWQERVGRNGRRFLLYKFRTYAAPFDWRGQPVPAERRLSAIGRFIRATRLDEMPQLLNVLIGDMSLIGPRPLLPQDQPADPSVRLMVRPGITGWAQVNGGTAISADEKDALDFWYIQHASLWLDLKVLVHTLIIVTTGERLNRNAIRQAVRWRETARSRMQGPYVGRFAPLQ